MSESEDAKKIRELLDQVNELSIAKAPTTVLIEFTSKMPEVCGYLSTAKQAMKAAAERAANGHLGIVVATDEAKKDMLEYMEQIQHESQKVREFVSDILLYFNKIRKVAEEIPVTPDIGGSKDNE